VPERPELDRYDVLIVGAGLAGCATARALARADTRGQRRILLIDLHPDCSPRFSGELIHPRGAAVLDELGFYAPLRARGAVDVDGFVVLEDAEGQHIELDYGSIAGVRPTGVSVHHKTLVRVMREVVREQAGVELRAGWRIVDVVREHASGRGRVVGARIRASDGAAGPDLEIRADLLVAADGKASPTRKLLGIPDRRETLGFTAGVEIVDARVGHPRAATVVLGAAGPMLCYPIEQREDGRLCSRLTFDLPHELPVKGPRLAEHLLRAFVPYLPLPLARQTAAAIARRRETHGQLEMAPTVDLPAPPATGEGFALVGDAAGCSHPITASGMTMGLLDASLLGREAARRDSISAREPWLTQRELRSYRIAHDRYVPTRQALADAVYEAFRGEGEGARAIRQALFAYWNASHHNRRRSLALLACAEGRPYVFLSEYIKTARHALHSSLAPRHARHFPVADRLRRMQGAVELASDKLGLVASVAWAQVKPGWLVR